ncbi:MAG TPA: VacB/RNase II family 3'-5' exoribonuclease [Bryobacteraceae bacterium]|nr:VacB/RNase II family 3'-5' exoribonuclease [Bryobacteraceae bacterium]
MGRRRAVEGEEAEGEGPAPQPFGESALLEHIARQPHARAGFKHLVREFGAKGAQREELEAALERLVGRGDLIEIKPGQYTVRARAREFAVGRLHMHRQGYGFLIAEHPVEGVTGDVFLPPEAAQKAMHGDRVLVRINRVERDGRADGEIVKILKRAQPTVVGEFRLGMRGQYVIPHDERIRQRIEIPDGLELPSGDNVANRIGAAAPQVSSAEELDGMVVNVELLEYPERGANPVGRVIEILGNPDDFGVDVEIVIRKHHLPHQFPAKVVTQAESIPNVIAARELAGRRDFRELDIVTIDGETARDFDDAVWVDRLPNGNFALQVHIADVSHYVLPGSPIDVEARLRGTSVYFPDRAVPMLPFELSTNICSLNPRVDRLVLSALLEIDHQGEIVAQEFMPGVIRSAERMTYTDVHLLLEGDAGLRARYARLVERFELMRELALVLNRKRVRRGSIDFDLPEPLIEFDEWGAMTGVTRAPRNIAHRIIEEFMLSANEAVAAHLEHTAIASVYRIHEKPDPKRVMEFEEVAAHFGYSLGIGAVPVRRFGIVSRQRDGGKQRKEMVLPAAGVPVSSRHYQKLVSKIEGKPEERILSYLMLRSLKQARYSTENVGHFALAATAYTHFTSPIRRYPDLIVHRLLRAVLAGGATPPASELSAIAEECSQSERRAADAERELVEWKKVRFMADRIGEEFDGLVISTAKYGLFVELADYFVEGLVPIDTLPGDEFTYRENVRKVVGKHSRREFSIGDRVRVMLERVDASERKLQFSLAEEEARPRRGGGRKASKRKRL